MEQQPPDLDENLNPVKPPDLNASGEPEQSTIGSLFKKVVDIANWPSERIASGVDRPIVGQGMMEIPGVSSATSSIEHSIDPTDSPFYSGVRPFIAGGVKLIGDTIASGFDPRTAGLKAMPETELGTAASAFKPKDIELPSATKPSAFTKPRIKAADVSKNLAEHGQMLPPADVNLQSDPVAKLNQALKESNPLNEEQAAIYRSERAEKLAKAGAVTKQGEAGAIERLAAMKGEHTKVGIEPIKLEQADVEGLFSHITNHPDLSATDKLHADSGLRKLLEGRVPQPNEVNTLKKTFGPEFATNAEHLTPEKADAVSHKLISEAVNLPRAVLSTLDFSAPLRQGLGLIHKKEYWNAFDDMFKAAGSQEAYDAVQQSIKDTPTFALSQDPKVKLRLTEFGDISHQEEKLIGSRLIEAFPGVKGSNRAYVAFLNKLRMDTFDSLIKSARAMGHDPDTNYHLTSQIADFVNNATGRGSLHHLEKNAELMNNMFFSPRLIASRLQMINPKNYLFTDPFVRKEYWKSLGAMTAAGNTFLGLASLAGATVSLDSNSADFGKARIGNTRFDPWGGFQQYGVLTSRLIQGKSTSSTTGRSYGLGSRYGLPTRGDVAKEFIKNKTNPIVKFAWDWMDATKNRPFDITNEMKQTLMPFIAQDIIDTYKDNPSLLPLVIPASTFGMGTQTY